MKVLVTGGTGYLGQAIVRRLAAQGHEPIVFARAASRSGLPGQCIDGDIRDRAGVARAASGTDAICHVAALVSIWRPRRTDFDDVNVGGLSHVIDACRTHRISRLVYTSSFLARPPAGHSTPLTANDYQRTKVEALGLARHASRDGVPIVTIVPGVVYGAGPVREGNLVGRLIADHLAGKLPGIIGADRQWSLSFIDDVADAHVAALTCGRPGEEYAAGGVNAVQMRLFEILAQLRRGTPLPRRLPDGLARLAGRLDEVRARMTGNPPRLTAGAAAIFRHDWPLDSGTSVEALGYRITPLEHGLKSVLEALPA